jgi:UrcA family protein
MKNQISFLGALLALAVISAADIAQSASQPTEQVTQHGPYLVKKTFTDEPYNASRTITSVSRDISYQGLDLTRDGDVTLLEARIRRVAEDICRELDRDHPKTIDPSAGRAKNCVETTSQSALAEVRTRVAAVRANSQSAESR